MKKIHQQDALRRRVQNFRKVARWSQYALGNAAGIDRARISFFECAYVALTDAEIERVETAMRDALGAAREELASAEKALLATG